MKVRIVIVFCFLFAGFLMPLSVCASDVELRVGLTRNFNNRTSIEIRNTRLVVGYGTPNGFHSVGELSSAAGFTVSLNAGVLTIWGQGGDSHRFSALGAPQIMAHSGDFILLESSSYRGRIEFRQSGASFTAINVISIEEYLYGVLPSEMPHTWHMQALMAQAVAARTFAFNRIVTAGHSARGFDICDSTHCQLYEGTAREHNNTTQAVRNTHGLMLFHGGNTIMANYFSSSGGATENSEDIWFEARPYLRSVVEIYEVDPLIWTRSVTWTQMTYGANRINANIGTVVGFSISGTNVNGRVTEITLHGTTGTRALTRDALRTFFSPIGGSLPSRMFTVEGQVTEPSLVYVTDGFLVFDAPLSDFFVLGAEGSMETVLTGFAYDGRVNVPLHEAHVKLSGGDGITIHGRGWGHGVGMSQRGAYGMARLGFGFREILAHYYTGVEIRRLH